MKSATVSIIIPVYNGSRYILSALATVQAQTMVDWELIIVDDGSTDDTANRLALAPADQRRHVIHQNNSGRSSARNRGLASAQGDLVAFLDVDDAWQPVYLASMCAAVETAPQAVAAFCGWQYMDEAGEPLPQAVLLSEQETKRLSADLLWRNSLLPSGLVARRRAIQQVGGFDETLHGTEDWDLWLRLSALGSFVAVPHALTWYRTHANSTTENLMVMERERLKLHAKHLGSLDEPLSEWPLGRRRAVGFTYFNSALGYFWQNDAANGRRKIGQAVRCWPGLLELDEFYYELGCANQPRGRRGLGQGLDLKASEALIGAILHDSSMPLAGQSIQSYWGRAYLVLARLARNVGNWPKCRVYALRAVPHLSGQDRTQAFRLLARSVTPEILVKTIRRGWRHPDAQPISSQ